MLRIKRDHKEEEWITVTPELAKIFLASSIGNRPESAHTVDAYARDIVAHKWYANGEPITFDTNGHMRNGHHRCLACIKANTPFVSLVVFGLPPEDCDEYDRCKARSFRDRMVLSEAEKWMASGSVITVVRTHFRTHGISKPTDSDIEGFMDRNKEELEWCYNTFLYKAKKNVKKAGVSLAIFYALKVGVNRDDLKEFAESVDTGLYDVSKGTAIYRLLKDLNSQSYGKSGNTAQKMLLLATENAIKDFIGRKDRTKTYLSHANPVWSNLEIISAL